MKKQHLITVKVRGILIERLVDVQFHVYINDYLVRVVVDSVVDGVGICFREYVWDSWTRKERNARKRYTSSTTFLTLYRHKLPDELVNAALKLRDEERYEALMCNHTL